MRLCVTYADSSKSVRLTELSTLAVISPPGRGMTGDRVVEFAGRPSPSLRHLVGLALSVVGPRRELVAVVQENPQVRVPLEIPVSDASRLVVRDGERQATLSLAGAVEVSLR